MGNFVFAPQGRWPREIALGFGYWLAFLLVLQPGNIARAHGDLVWTQELIRIAGAGLLGASVTPVVLTLTRRLPIVGEGFWRRAVAHLAANFGLAVALILVSCVLALLILVNETRPLLIAMRQELLVNGPLVFFSLCGLTALAHAARSLRPERPAEQAAPSYLTCVATKMRGVTTVVALSDVSWVETQGNYVALHTEDGVHLLRETLARFEPQLDPERFVRIHRRALVAVDRVRAIETKGSGDGLVHLTDGTELRLSRRFREALRARFETRQPPP